MFVHVTPDSIFSLTREPAEEFFKESKIDGVLDFPHFCQSWGKLIELDMAAIIVYVDDQQRTLGIIGGTCTKCLMTGDMIAQESFWWVHPSKRRSPVGIKLLRQWEGWGEDRGAKRIYVGNLAAVNHEMMHTLYSKLGYQLLETHYVRPV
jgi:GNAT superfamily N-acetyltransferase